MSETTEQWRNTIAARLADLLNNLDDRHEWLVAAHVATALDCLCQTPSDNIVDIE